MVGGILHFRFPPPAALHAVSSGHSEASVGPGPESPCADFSSRGRVRSECTASGYPVLVPHWDGPWTEHRPPNYTPRSHPQQTSVMDQLWSWGQWQPLLREREPRLGCLYKMGVTLAPVSWGSGQTSEGSCDGETPRCSPNSVHSLGTQESSGLRSALWGVQCSVLCHRTEVTKTCQYGLSQGLGHSD